MGTSSIYGGPNDRNPLLPEGFNDDLDNDQESKADDENSNNPEKEDTPVKGSWQETKKAMSQYITGSSNSRGRVVSNYVKASGGSRAASNQAISGKSSTVQLGRLLLSISQIGILRTFEKLHIDYIGKSIETLLSEIVNLISPNSDTKEDIIARNATIEVQCMIYEFIEENQMDITSLDRMNEVIFDEIMRSYVSTYIFERMLNDLQSRFERYADNAQIALQKEKEIREYVKVSVEIKFDDIKMSKLDYNDKSIDSIIGNLYRECYEVLEVSL
ncbi:hypothetical protein [Paenibacillus donghaensis]|uniref:Uncharacterized protein n=1 Tax=Paenibacillus donghaensis TaxID=414771 RepID=A0A2Z2KPW3_9BACL|nr:hypothetical protein [Paenibacillus donghaensis]ASA23372.1 hypothetical protein B9T62_22735 [Paenibacillus donghaensis]